MSWKETEGQRGEGGGSHLYIKANQTVKVHVLLKQGEEPISFWTHFFRTTSGKNTNVICPGKDICPICQAGTIKGRRRHAVNVWEYENNKVRILEGGNTIFQQIKLIYDQFQGLDGIDLLIKRIGSTRDDTVYTVSAIQMANKFDWTGKTQFDLDILKSPDSPVKIRSLIAGGVISQPASTPAPTEQSITPAQDERLNLMSEVQSTINTKYKDKFSEVIEKMRQVTATSVRPAGKTLLMDYTVEELKALLGIIR